MKGRVKGKPTVSFGEPGHAFSGAYFACFTPFLISNADFHDKKIQKGVKRVLVYNTALTPTQIQSNYNNLS